MFGGRRMKRRLRHRARAVECHPGRRFWRRTTGEVALVWPFYFRTATPDLRAECSPTPLRLEARACDMEHTEPCAHPKQIATQIIGDVAAFFARSQGSKAFLIRYSTHRRARATAWLPPDALRFMMFRCERDSLVHSKFVLCHLISLKILGVCLTFLGSVTTTCS
jgi:hypothetical protein